MPTDTDTKKQEFFNLYRDSNSFSVPEHIRKKILDHIEQLSFPTLRDEEWRKTNIKPILDMNYVLAKPTDPGKEKMARFMIPKLEANLLVFINGHFSPIYSNLLSGNKKIIIDSLENAVKKYPEIIKKHFEQSNLHEKNIFTALNTAFARNGVFIHLPKNSVLEHPVQLLFFNDTQNNENFTQTRNLIIAGENSESKILESHYSINRGDFFSNHVNEIILNDNAKIDYHRFQDEDDSTFQINYTRVTQNQHSRFTCNNINHHGGIVRNNLDIKLNGKGADARLYGMYLGTDKELFDNHLFVEHAKPHCTSTQLYKGILDDTSKGVFSGKIYVAKDAQQTIAQQSNRNIVLTDEAKVHSKPQLEIYADDVSCSHGSTTGQMNQDALFYLQTRGISKEKAVLMLLHAFASEVIEKISIEPYKETIEQLLNEDYGA